MINNFSLKVVPSFFYGLNKEFRIELDEKLTKEINSQLEENWLSNQNAKEVWRNDSDSSETKGKFSKKIVKFLDLSGELEDAVYKKDINHSWNYLNTLPIEEVGRRNKEAKKALEEYGERYYHILDQIPAKLNSFCADEIGKSIAGKKLLAQLFLLNPFHGYRDKNSDLGLIMRAGLLYGLVVQLLLIGLTTLRTPSKFLTWIVLAGKKYRQTINNLFNEVHILSEKIARGESGINGVHSLKHLFGEKVVHELREELDELHQIRRDASTIYIKYLLLQFLSRDIDLNRITFDSNKSLKVDLYLYPEIDHKRLQRLSNFERDVFWGKIELGGSHNPQTGLEYLLEYLDENKYYRGMDHIFDKLSERFKEELLFDSSDQKSIKRMLKKLARTNEINKVRQWIWTLYHKIT